MFKKLSFLTRTSLLVAFFLAIDKALAFLRSVLIARQFTLSTELDAFNAANNLPDLLFAMISGGALAMAFIPVMSETLFLDGRKAAWDLFSRFANLGFMATAVAALVVAVFSDQIVSAQVGIVPGFAPEHQRLVAELMRLNLVATLIFSVSGLVMAGLQAHQHFLLPALAPSLYNLGMIFGVLVLSPSEPYRIGGLALPAFGLGVHGLVYGVILGAALHLTIQIPGLVKYKFHWTPSVTLNDKRVREVLKLVGPRLLTMLGIQLVFIARDNLASRLGQTGSVSALTYGWMIMQVPETIIGTAIAITLLPTLSELAARKEWEAFRQTIEKAIRVLVALTLPAAAVIAVGLHPLVRAVFHLGEVDALMLTWTARMYFLSLTGYTIHEVVVRSFYARKEAWWPFFGVLIRLSLFLIIGVLAVTSFRRFGAPGLALAEFAIVIESLFLLAWLNRRLAQPIQGWPALFKGLLAAVLCGAVTYVLAVFLPGSAVWTALAGMLAGTTLAIPIVWTEFRLLFKL